MTAPWWMCGGWLHSWWCIADNATRCKVRWICDRHDRSIVGDDDHALRLEARYVIDVQP